MSLAAFTFTDRCRPVVELGIGDTRVPVASAQWDVARWDNPAALWSGDEPLWQDVTCDVHRAECSYGRAAVIDRFIAGTATVLVDNATGWADPSATVTPGILTMRPGRAIRVGVDHQVYGRVWLFRGVIDAVTPTYDPVHNDVVELSCIDALGEVNRVKLVPLQTPAYAGDNAHVRTHRVLDLADWATDKRDVMASGVTLIASDMGGQVADLLGVIAESCGGAVFGDLNGDIAFRSRDWQAFEPGDPVDGTIGNVEKGHTIPGVPAIPGYLTPTVGTATTPDPGPPPTQYTLVFTVLGPTAAAGVIAAQWVAAPQLAFDMSRLPPGDNRISLSSSPDGTASGPFRSVAGAAASTPAADQTLALAVNLTNGTNAVLRAWQRVAGVWTAGATATSAPATVFDSNAVVRVGARGNGTAGVFTGRIYSVELRTGLDPAAGTVLWRFDADDYPGTGTSYVDPRGRTWTLTAANAITPKVPAVPEVVVPPDVCPTGWTRPFDRADITTRVLLARQSDEPWQTLQSDDVEGQVLYGIEPFERTYLLTESVPYLTQLAERILVTRGAATAPRVRSVGLDARTGDEALDLMSTVQVYKPSRYRCRLNYPPPHGLVFDDEYFATAVHHELDPDTWTLALNLDVAEPFALTDPSTWDWGEWDAALWK